MMAGAEAPNIKTTALLWTMSLRDKKRTSLKGRTQSRHTLFYSYWQLGNDNMLPYDVGTKHRHMKLSEHQWLLVF
jgi:hypothetical protein